MKGNDIDVTDGMTADLLDAEQISESGIDHEIVALFELNSLKM